MNIKESKRIKETKKLLPTALAKKVDLSQKWEKKIELSHNNTQQKKILILDSIRSVINVGSIFRTADASGIDKVYLTGYCPTPLDRFGRIRNDFQKASLDAKVDWEYTEDIQVLTENLKKNGFYIVSVEQDEKSIDYKKVSLSEKEKVAVVMGNENFGVNKKVLEVSDAIVELPMYGHKNSLNVSVTTGIILYAFFDVCCID